MRFRHRASVSPAFGRGGGVEPYRGSETYLGEQATLRQELGDVGGKHDVSVDGGGGGSEVSGEPISKGYARAPRSRGSRARETRRRRRRDACRSIRTRSNACIARIEDRARVRYRAGHRRRARRGFRRARGNPRLRARTPFVACSETNSASRRAGKRRTHAHVPVLVDVVVVLLGVLNLRHVVLSSRCRVGRAERSGRERGDATLSLKRSFHAHASKHALPTRHTSKCSSEISRPSYAQLP